MRIPKLFMSRSLPRRVFAVAALLVPWLSTPLTPAQPPAPASNEQSRMVEGVAFAKDASLLNLTPEQQIVAYRNLRLLAPHTVVKRGTKVSPLPAAPIELTKFTYKYSDRTRTVEDFITDTRVAGILVIKNGRVVYERYAQGNGPASMWTSFSVAKSVLSLLFGAALKDGSIRSLDDPVTRYLPSLNGSAYDVVTIRQLLQMSSGVAWNEDETDPQSDLARFARVGPAEGIEGQLAYMKRLPRKAPPGTVFNYNTGETNLAGALLRAAVRRPLAEYLSERIWKPAGMEADAYWLQVREGDIEFGGCCISATLRDYGRLGLLAMNGGVTLAGKRILPEGWIRDSTKPAATAPDYGHLWWLEGGGRYAASGIFGQYIYIVPEHKLVVAIHSAWPVAYNEELPAHRRAFLEALTRELVSRDKARR